MQKTTSALLGALVLLVTGLVVWGARPRSSSAVVVPAMASAAAVLSEAEPEGTSDAGAAVDILRDPSFQGIRGTKPGFALLDGTKPPELSAEAPRAVRFGIVLVQYRGAERAPLASRSKAEALGLAQTLLETAKTDFAGAVEKGDVGSTAAAGWMPRGVLEPAPEYVLFTTAPGDVGGPVDTPTGYWIVKNIGKVK